MKKLIIEVKNISDYDIIEIKNFNVEKEEEKGIYIYNKDVICYAHIEEIED